ncbi:MAG: tRNA (guanosine(37)-N1)-methyltransferase TrmD [Desulfobulbaceae bacterium]|uniref:tRNA (guanine-N(1)-)-methyltransferase n=1 Tax=Candidatus Desulfatifera sulfidica TaxID=2841691 RepID=A0A8J6NAD8_9BACT|nr:tRNA (guanosine(37)-N1)-methyltransferase TrmD [Candidatus Desulfatifera sulfidica]
MIFDILTIFPELLDSPLNESIIRRAREQGHIRIKNTNIRDFALDKHATTDDRPFGGGEGMVMKADVLQAAVHHVRNENGPGHVILLSPQGRPYNQAVAEELSRRKHLILVCGRYEGVDERFRANCVDDEISIGDYILTGGELAAMVIVDSVTRLLPEVLGCADSAEQDTFSRGLLKHPQYTRPREYAGQDVPDVLLSGNHAQIDEFRFLTSVRQTLERRPDLLPAVTFTPAEIKLLKKQGLYTEIIKQQAKKT